MFLLGVHRDVMPSWYNVPAEGTSVDKLMPAKVYLWQGSLIQDVFVHALMCTDVYECVCKKFFQYDLHLYIRLICLSSTLNKYIDIDKVLQESIQGKIFTRYFNAAELLQNALRSRLPNKYRLP